MKYIHIHVARICRAINEYLGAHGHSLPAYGEESQRSVASTVRDLLEEETVLSDMLEDQYYEVTRSFGCPYSVEEALILGTTGFNPEPLELYLAKQCTLDAAIETCFAQTFYDALRDQYGEEPEEQEPELELELVKN